MDAAQYRELWLEAPDGQLLCALINGGQGWLMYLRQGEDPGFSSRNPAYAGSLNATIEYHLNNGQVDEYPASWALPIGEVERALAFFKANNRPPSFVLWHNDAGDGVVLEYKNA